jgi:hypothetical protein
MPTRTSLMIIAGKGSGRWKLKAMGKDIHFEWRKNLEFAELEQIHEFCRHADTIALYPLFRREGEYF